MFCSNKKIFNEKILKIDIFTIERKTPQILIIHNFSSWQPIGTVFWKNISTFVVYRFAKSQTQQINLLFAVISQSRYQKSVDF
jgi:hypothetical protein